MPDPRHLLDALRRDTLVRLGATEAALTDLVRERAAANDDDEHDPEGVPLSAEWSRLRGLADADRAELAWIDEAEQRVEDGTYGICAGCGKPIPAARLEARPFAEYCVACAEARGR